MALKETKLRKLRTTDKPQIVRDSAGLHLRIPAGEPGQPIERASWVCRITRAGRTSKATLGHWPQMSVERARRERDRMTGVNTDLGVTVAEAVDDYRLWVVDELKSGYQSEVYLRHFTAGHGNRKLAAVTRAECVTLVKRYSKERGARSADRLLSQLRGIFNHAVDVGYLEVSPLLGVSKRVTGYTPQARERVLTADEIRELWNWDHPNAALLRFLLLTGLRISEAQKGYLDGSRWVVPAKYSKNGRAHWVHVTESATNQLVVPFNRSPTAVQAWVKRRQDSRLNRWTPHDLRRTASTLINENGVEPFIAERVLGHSLTGVMAVYNRAEYEAERIRAAEILEKVVLECIDTP